MIPAFTKAGVKGMVLVASNAAKLSTVEASVKQANPELETLTCAVDISKSEGVEKAFERIKQRFSHADILINAAGVLTGDGPKLHETNVDEWWNNFVRLSLCQLLSPSPVIPPKKKKKKKRSCLTIPPT